MTTQRYLLILPFCLFFIPTFLYAQTSNKTYHPTENPNVFKNDEGATIEYLGLKGWTAQQVQDSLKSLAPNRPVHACVAILKNTFGFEDAEVNSITRVNEDGSRLPTYTRVTLVEPNPKKKNGIWKLPSSEKPIIQKWTAGYDLSDNKVRGQVIFGSQFWQKKSGGKLLWPRVMKASFISEEEKKFLKKFYGNIAKQDSRTDREQAYQTMENDGNIDNRILASLVLLNFEADQKDFYAMLNQIRSESDQLNTLSGRILNVMAQDSQKVDWSGATESIKAILNGTSVKEFPDVLEILTTTKISPELSKVLLPNNTFLLKEYLRSSNADTRSTAMAFVKQISGKNFTNHDNAIEWLSQYD